MYGTNVANCVTAHCIEAQEQQGTKKVGVPCSKLHIGTIGQPRETMVSCMLTLPGISQSFHW